jgi:hypothetical protein
VPYSFSDTSHRQYRPSLRTPGRVAFPHHWAQMFFADGKR